MDTEEFIASDEDVTYQRERKKILERVLCGIGGIVVILWVSISVILQERMKEFRPSVSVIDVAIGDGVVTLPLIICAFRGLTSTQAACLYYGMVLLFGALLSKLWVFEWTVTVGASVGVACTLCTFVARLVVLFLWRRTDSGVGLRSKLSMRALGKILRPYFIPTGAFNKFLVFLTWVVVALGRVCSVIAPIVLGNVVNELSESPPRTPYGTIALLAALSLGPYIFSEIQDILYVKVWQTAYAEVADTTFRHLHSLSLEWHLGKHMGNTIRSMDRGMEATDNVMYGLLIVVVPAVGSGIATFAVLTSHFGQAAIAGICFFGFFLYCWATYVVTVWRQKFRETMNQHDNDMHTRLSDSLVNFETVKYFTNEVYEAEEYLKAVRAYQRGTYSSQASIAALNLAQSSSIQLTTMGALMLAAYSIMHHDEGFTVGSFVAVQAFVVTVFQPLSILGIIYTQIVNGIVDIQNLSELLAEVPDVVDAAGAVPLAVPAEGAAVEFRDVSFRYAAQPAGRGLRGVTFAVPPGTMTAIVGHTGSGKTTLSRLLFRFYDVQEGSIRICGQDVRDVTQRSLRAAIGIVPQDTVLFNNSLLYNIRYGNVDASGAQVDEASRAAQVQTFVGKLEKGYDTVVGERGLKLSGGEKQRVAIARCLLKDPPIVLLDEATSALDNETEREVQAALQCLAGRTILVIAHRLTTVQHADQIIVLHDGMIVERGRHDELLALQGAYSKMWFSQSRPESQ